MLDGQVSLLTLAAARYFALGEVPPRLGTEHPGRVPSASFCCADGNWLHITCADQHWTAFCEVLGLAEWGAAAERANNTARLANRVEIMRVLTHAIASWTRSDLLNALEAADVPAGPLNSIDQILADQHVAARHVVGEFNDPVIGRFPALGLPYKFNGWDDPEIGRPPQLGEHTDEVLRERLGLTPARIEELRRDKVI
jgi:crotonobetainyl-CoA:carnitine CoA-transferase CaiB-like acyl-CoA transferase